MLAQNRSLFMAFHFPILPSAGSFRTEEKTQSEMTSTDQNVLQFITEQKREKQESLDMIYELERQLQAKQQLETKIKDVQKKLQEAMKEAILSENLLHVTQNLQTGVEDLKLKLQGTSTLTVQLESELDAKHKLETKIKELKGNLVVRDYITERNMTAEHIEEIIKEELQDRIKEMDSLEDLCQALIIKESQSNNELVEVRKELYRGFTDLVNGQSSIGIKRIGEIDMKPFKKRFREVQAAQWLSFWQDKVQDPSWYPFMIVTSEDGNSKETINEDDELVKRLRESWGADIYESVITALQELNEYNPSGRYVVPGIWNFKEKRKATTKEAVACLVDHLKTLKRKRG